MRIVFIQDRLRAGGTESQTLFLAQGLAERGSETHVVAFRRGGPLLDALPNPPAFRLRFLRQGPFKTDWFAPGLDRLLRALAPDAVVAMGRMANCHLGSQLLLGRKPPFATVATFRTGKPIPFLYRAALARADCLVANSREALRRLEGRYGIRHANAAVIRNPCRLAFPQEAAAPDQAQQKASPPPDPGARPSPTVLLNVSLFRPEKRQIELVRLCAALRPDPPWRLVLAGDGPCRAACEREARRLDLADRVSFPGFAADPRPLYAQADLAVHASCAESLPNFLVEAQTCGLPVVAYRVGGVDETFAPKESGFAIPLDDRDAFVERLQALLDEPERRAAMAAAARRFARRRFSPEAQLETYCQTLAALQAS